MKTAISIPEPIFKTAERLAKRLGLSRSELYVRAISSYVESQKGQRVTDLLNEIYIDSTDNTLNRQLNRAQLKSINQKSTIKEEW